jgi:hypothetical protein
VSFPLPENATMSTGAAAAAAAAAAERARQEEEEMTPYSEKDLAEGWEFKILRSNMRAFRNLENLKKYLEEEGRAGWELVEKFDDSRLRLKRPASARQADADLDFDPYRTQVGMSDIKMALLILGIIMAVLFGVIGVILLAVKS